MQITKTAYTTLTKNRRRR